MIRFILRRLFLLIPVLLGVTVIVFGLIQFTPGDPALVVAGPEATEEELENVRKFMGLDRPLHEQYFTFLYNAVQGDFGISSTSRRPVLNEVLDRLPATFELAIAGLAVACVIGVATGVLAATKKNSPFDLISMIVALLGVSMPVFWLAILMMMLFSVELGWFPTSGRGTWKHLVMPAVALGLGSAAIIARQTRSAMLDVLNQDYIRTARAKGLANGTVTRRHAIRNAAIPIVTVIGLQFGAMLGGAVITETVFAWPGVGQMIVRAIHHRDLLVVQAGVLIVATVFVLVNLLVEVLYAAIDPKVKYF